MISAAVNVAILQFGCLEHQFDITTQAADDCRPLLVRRARHSPVGPTFTRTRPHVALRQTLENLIV